MATCGMGSIPDASHAVPPGGHRLEVVLDWHWYRLESLSAYSPTCSACPIVQVTMQAHTMPPGHSRALLRLQPRGGDCRPGQTLRPRATQVFKGLCQSHLPVTQCLSTLGHAGGALTELRHSSIHQRLPNLRCGLVNSPQRVCPASLLGPGELHRHCTVSGSLLQVRQIGACGGRHGLTPRLWLVAHQGLQAMSSPHSWWLRLQKVGCKSVAACSRWGTPALLSCWLVQKRPADQRHAVSTDEEAGRAKAIAPLWLQHCVQGSCSGVYWPSSGPLASVRLAVPRQRHHAPHAWIPSSLVSLLLQSLR